MASSNTSGKTQSEQDLLVSKLLELCNVNNVEIPKDVKQELQEHGLMPKREIEASGDRPLSHRQYLRSLRESWVSQEAKLEAAVEPEDSRVANFRQKLEVLKSKLPKLELIIKDGRYKVTNTVEEHTRRGVDKDDTPSGRARQNIQTVQGPIAKIRRLIQLARGDIQKVHIEKTIMDGVNLVFEPGKMYLVLGAPGSGKSTLLRMIANMLPQNKSSVQEGTVSITGVTPSKDVVWQSLVAYIDQIDRLHPFMTVKETCEFAWRCRSGGTHRRKWLGHGPEVDKLIAEMDEELAVVHLVMDVLGLTRVKDTFVGDQEQVRGVSGGEKKRVTVAEMLCVGAPIVCCDEISTGLDAATTFDIVRLLGEGNRMTQSIKIVSLLQPPPETVALFDEIILVDQGRIMYSGPVDDVLEHFESLGYSIPERMDVADWLQELPTPKGAQFLSNPDQKHLSNQEFVRAFNNSERGKILLEKVNEPQNGNSKDVENILSMASVRYANPWYKSLDLLCRREVLLWWRDKYQIKAKVAQTIIMGVVAGTLFWQTDDVNNIISILFQSMFYACIAQMTLVVRQFPARSIFYKQSTASFFPTWSYVVGRSVATIPIAFTDAIGYGTVIYFFVGLAYDEGATLANYFIWLLLLFLLSLTTGLFFSMYSALAETINVAQALNALTAIVFVLFSGFTVQPDVIPVYWIWVYWVNLFGWALRGLAVNEFASGKYDDPLEGNPDLTEGEAILIRFGFTLNDEAFGSAWVWWGILFVLGWAILAILGSTVFLDKIRYTTGKSLLLEAGSDQIEEMDEADRVAIPFTKVNLTFKDIRYTVTASTTNEKLELLKGIDGVIEANKMTALMGSSGAGKTTLMDVLSLRKNSGEITGQVRLNGHPQEEMSFRRCAGYVEQFDVQSPQLTIRETMEFSARLRLDESDPAVTDESIQAFVDQTLHMLELTNQQDLQVGSDATGGLSFEQKKRLSIAVELVANPSILFLDEPTSGLDARAASIVMAGMKRIAASGRAVCATIHQPSIAIFSDFDSLLLLKRGGETVFFGDLGNESINLIRYLEQYETTTKIQPGENPATWMLTTIGAGNAASSGSKPFDYASAYASSNLRAQTLEKIEKINEAASEDNEVKYKSKHATSQRTQGKVVFFRALKIYWRSPSYNQVRLTVAGIVSLLFASVYASDPTPRSESDMNSRINSIYIATLFMSVNALNTVLAVFEAERNMFYRHQSASMYDSWAMVKAFTMAEFPFILGASTIFVMLFYWVMGFAKEADRFFLFWLFFFLTQASYTFLGQMLSSLFRDTVTAQGFGGLISAFSSLFGGVLIRLSEIPSFWVFMYWVFPGHYFLEGLIMSQFDGDDRLIEASPGSPFFLELGCGTSVVEVCEGSIDVWIGTYFTDWSVDNVKWNVLYLLVLILVTRVITFWALVNINYRAT